MARLLNFGLSFLCCLIFGGCFFSSKKGVGPSPDDTLLKKRVATTGSDYGTGYFQELEPRSESFSLNSGNEFGGIYNKDDVRSVVYFKFDNSELSAEAKSTLVEVANELKADNRLKALLVGHCDWHGTEDYNIKLGERRAGSAESYLNALGCDVRRVETLSLGSTHAAQGLTKDTAWRDRRCDIVFFPKKTK